MRYFTYLKVRSYLAFALGVFYTMYAIVIQKAISFLEINEISFFELMNDLLNLIFIYVAYSAISESIKRALLIDSLIQITMYMIGVVVVMTNLNLGYYVKINGLVMGVLGMLVAEAVRHYETVRLGGSPIKSNLIKRFNKKYKLNLLIGGLFGSSTAYLISALGLGLVELSMITYSLGLVLEIINLWLVIKLKP